MVGDALQSQWCYCKIKKDEKGREPAEGRAGVVEWLFWDFRDFATVNLRILARLEVGKLCFVAGTTVSSIEWILGGRRKKSRDVR